MIIFLSMLETDEDRKLFMELYSQYGDVMLRVAKKFFPNDMYTAEDAVQNAWMRVVDNFSKILAVPSKKRGAYLVIIVKNESISILRKDKQDMSLDDDLVGVFTEAFDDNTKSIIEIIQAMPDTYRAVLEMRFVEECSTKEIAKALSLKETTVDVRIHRGRALLIKKLMEEGYAK